MEQTSNQPSINFWIISILAFVWNFIGVFTYVGQTLMSDKILKSLSKPEQHYFSNIPSWVTAAFATAVFAGLFGAICLLYKKKISHILFILSMIALIVYQNYNFFLQDYLKISNTDLILPIATTVIGISLIWFSSKMSRQGVLN